MNGMSFMGDIKDLFGFYHPYNAQARSMFSRIWWCQIHRSAEWQVHNFTFWGWKKPNTQYKLDMLGDVYDDCRFLHNMICMHSILYPCFLVSLVITFDLLCTLIIAAILQFPAVHKKKPPRPGYRRIKINRKIYWSQLNIGTYAFLLLSVFLMHYFLVSLEIAIY